MRYQLKIRLKKNNKQYLLSFDNGSSISERVNSDWFKPDDWQLKDRIIGQSAGRQIAWFIRPEPSLDQSDWVLRHYYRGGMIAKLTRDRFVFTGLSKTRCWREMSLLQSMTEMGLPVPRAIAGQFVRTGFFYSADLLMQKLNARDLVFHLSKGAINPEIWKNIGSVIRQFHDHGIFHADLNAHNIMLDGANKVWLIDFDRCEQRPIKAKWQQQNLQRLHRSFIKEKAISGIFAFSDSDWNCLLLGYRG